MNNKINNYNMNDIIIICILCALLCCCLKRKQIREHFKYINSINPIGYMDIMKDNKIYTIEIELYEKDTPVAVQNFKHLLTGNYGYNSDNIPITYKYSSFYKIEPNNALYGGDFITNNGTSGQSIYNKPFKDEIKGLKKINSVGTIAMNNNGQANNNDSRFIINLKNNPEFNNNYVVIGSIVSNFNILQEIAENPKSNATIVKCGLIYNI